MPVETARGGINACEPPFIEAMESLGHETVSATYLFDNPPGTGFLRRVSQVVSAAAALKRTLRAERFDVVHLNTSFEFRSLLRDAYTLFLVGGQRVFLKFHGSNLRLLRSPNPLVRLLVKFVVGRACGIGVLSDEERKGFIESGVPEGKVHLVGNAVPVLSHETRERFPHVEIVPAGTCRLLFVSRLVPTKGLEDSIRAVALLARAGRDVRLEILGDGESREPAESLVHGLGLGDRVVFRGHVGETAVESAYASSDILVFPTFHDEGFPMVVFRALGFGLPVVTTRKRACADRLEEGVNCLFCREHDPESVASCVARLMDDPGLCSSMSSANLMLSERFTPQKTASEYAEIYRRMI